MLEQLSDLPAGVLGFTAVGKLHSDDYRDVLIPAIERAIADGHRVRVLLEFPTFDGMSAGATWEDLKMGIGHLTHWKRIALVTDIEWMIHLTSLFGWMTPGEMKRFPLDERAAVLVWVASD